MTQNVALLTDRGVIAVDGPDAEKLLQGLISNSIEKTNDNPAQGTHTAVFAGLLTPQGKILFDFFVIRKKENNYLLDAPASLVADLIKRLNFYKLRAQVNIQDRTAKFSVLASWGNHENKALLEDPETIIYHDPRLPALGHRWLVQQAEISSLIAKTQALEVSEKAYHAHRITLGIPQGGIDYVYGDTFPHEACYDQINGVDFKKGCYVGQEVVSRMQHRGTARKRIVHVSAPTPLPATGTDIKLGDLVIGRLGSVHETEGLALVRLDRAAKAMAEQKDIEVEGVSLTLALPKWANYNFEVTSGEEQ